MSEVLLVVFVMFFKDPFLVIGLGGVVGNDGGADVGNGGGAELGSGGGSISSRFIFLTGFGGNGGTLLLELVVSLSDLLLNSLILAETSPMDGEEGEDILN